MRPSPETCSAPSAMLPRTSQTATTTRGSFRRRLTFQESERVHTYSSAPSTAYQTGVATPVPFFR